MTRTIICAIFFSQTIFGFSKGNYFFPDITFKDITFKEVNKKNTLKIVKGLREYKRIFGPADIYDKGNYFYLSDIDNDNTSELIYYGLIGAEGKWSIIWKVDHQNYQLCGELSGEITGISDSSYLSTWGPGCCGSDCHFANLYRITEDEIDFLRCTVIFNRVKIPDSLPIKKHIVINNTGYSLRAQPMINDNPDSTDMERYGVLRGNTIVELGKGTVASATATYTDTTGRVWWFLIMDNPSEAKYNLYKKYKREKRQIGGWISTQHLDYKEIDQDSQD